MFNIYQVPQGSIAPQSSPEPATKAVGSNSLVPPATKAVGSNSPVPPAIVAVRTFNIYDVTPEELCKTPQPAFKPPAVSKRARQVPLPPKRPHQVSKPPLPKRPRQVPEPPRPRHQVSKPPLPVVSKRPPKVHQRAHATDPTDLLQRFRVHYQGPVKVLEQVRTIMALKQQPKGPGYAVLKGRPGSGKVTAVRHVARELGHKVHVISHDQLLFDSKQPHKLRDRLMQVLTMRDPFTPHEKAVVVFPGVDGWHPGMRKALVEAVVMMTDGQKGTKKRPRVPPQSYHPCFMTTSGVYFRDERQLHRRATVVPVPSPSPQQIMSVLQQIMSVRQFSSKAAVPQAHLESWAATRDMRQALLYLQLYLQADAVGEVDMPDPEALQYFPVMDRILSPGRPPGAAERERLAHFDRHMLSMGLHANLPHLRTADGLSDPELADSLSLCDAAGFGEVWDTVLVYQAGSGPRLRGRAQFPTRMNAVQQATRRDKLLRESAWSYRMRETVWQARERISLIPETRAPALALPHPAKESAKLRAHFDRAFDVQKRI